MAFRAQDQADIETLLLAHRDQLDVDFIRREWSTVAAGEDERTEWLEAAIQQNVLPGPECG